MSQSVCKTLPLHTQLILMTRAQAWLDRELQRDPKYDINAPEANLTSQGVVDFEESLRNGIALAKLARVFDQDVPNSPRVSIYVVRYA